MIKKYKKRIYIIFFNVALLILTLYTIMTGYFIIYKTRSATKRIDALEQKIDAYGLVFDWEGEKAR